MRRPTHAKPVDRLRTACLTGVAHRKMAEPIDLSSGNHLTLTAGDLAKPLPGLTTNRIGRQRRDGTSVPAGFTRIAVVPRRCGRHMDPCYTRSGFGELMQLRYQLIGT